jgi:hypothetical protein
MLRGKKVMHLLTHLVLNIPGETVMIPSNVEMKIDSLKLPKKSHSMFGVGYRPIKISSTLHLLNERYPKA